MTPTIEGSFKKLTAPIRTWMKANVTRWTDVRTGEVNMTRMVEEWDLECASGSDTLDPDHPAWDVATEFVDI